MEQRRITLSDIVLGEPLPWDVYDADQHLLLRKGHVIDRIEHAQSLMERGLYIDARAVAGKTAPSVPPRPETPSAVRLINLVNKRLERLLPGIAGESDVQARIFDAVKLIGLALDISPDIALACILLNQQAGEYPIRHCVDTAVVSLLVARALKKEPEEALTITAAALTMNVGMLQHPELLQNRQNSLSDADVALIRRHPEDGVALLRQAGIDNPEWLSYVLLHHENEDGSGYPFGKSGAAIPVNVKLISLADRYCARVSLRNYRKALLPNAALRDILLADKKNIDPMLAAALVRELGTYPTGSFVKLANGEIGVVIGRGASTTTPIVHALVGPHGAPFSSPIKRDTSCDTYAVREVLHGEQTRIRITMQQLWGDRASA